MSSETTLLAGGSGCAAGPEPHATRGTTGHWVFDDFAINSAESMVSTQRVFTEVQRQAGVSLVVPAVGPENLDPVFNFDRGAAAGDLNHDGLLDFVATTKDRVLVYLNQGDGHFREISAEINIPNAPEAPLLLD